MATKVLYCVMTHNGYINFLKTLCLTKEKVVMFPKIDDSLLFMNYRHSDETLCLKILNFLNTLMCVENTDDISIEIGAHFWQLLRKIVLI